MNYFVVGGLLLSYLSTYIAPSSSSLLPFFGLAYPLFLFANIFFVTLWLFKRRKLLFLSLFAIVVGISHLSHFGQITFLNRNHEDKLTEVKLMSYNVRVFDLYNWTKNKETRNKMFDFLVNENPDILCFQEFFWSSKKKADFRTKDTLMKILGMPHVAEGYTVRNNRQENYGLCIMSKYPIIKTELVRFSNDKMNGFMYADLKIDQDTIRLYNAHCGSARFEQEDYEAIGAEGNFKKWPHVASTKNSNVVSRLKSAYIRREAQTRELLAHMKTSKFKNVLAGDFNDTPISYNYRQLTENLYDSFTLSANGLSGTFAKVPMQRIDYIMHVPEINSFDYIRHPQDFSDHHAISATIEF